ncbi:hypothetical protein ES708_21000 [subsurface metagenome]
MYKEKTNKELILEILEECKGTKEEEEIRKRLAKLTDVKKDSAYRLPMKKMINSYAWANLNKPGKAALPVIGNHQHKVTGACYAARETMAQYTGCSVPTISEGLKSLVSEGVITKEKGWPCKNYYLTDKAKWEKGTYFPFFRFQIEVGYWARLEPCEKALYVVYAIKGSTKHPEICGDSEIYSIGQVKKGKIKQYRKWAGITKPAYKKAKEGLINKSLLWMDDDGTYYIYWLQCINEKKQGK